MTCENCTWLSMEASMALDEKDREVRALKAALTQAVEALERSDDWMSSNPPTDGYGLLDNPERTSIRITNDSAIEAGRKALGR